MVFTPHYTASFLTDKLDNMCAVTAPLIEMNIPLNPKPENAVTDPATGFSKITTCETWAGGGAGIREAFAKMTAGCTVHTGTRVTDVIVDGATGRKRVYDEHGRVTEVDRVVFACPCNAVGNMHKGHNWVEARRKSAEHSRTLNTMHFTAFYL